MAKNKETLNKSEMLHDLTSLESSVDSCLSEIAILIDDYSINVEWNSIQDKILKKIKSLKSEIENEYDVIQVGPCSFERIQKNNS